MWPKRNIVTALAAMGPDGLFDALIASRDRPLASDRESPS